MAILVQTPTRPPHHQHQTNLVQQTIDIPNNIQVVTTNMNCTIRLECKDNTLESALCTVWMSPRTEQQSEQHPPSPPNASSTTSELLHLLVNDKMPGSLAKTPAPAAQTTDVSSLTRLPSDQTSGSGVRYSTRNTNYRTHHREPKPQHAQQR